MSLRSLQRALSPLLCVVSLGALAAGCGANTESVGKDVCASGIRWVADDTGSDEMNPGQPCLDCHSRNDGPKFSAGGTVFADAKQADNCFGRSGITVQITDAAGKVFTTTTNEAGNFSFRDPIAMPYSATVTFNGTTLPMGVKPMTGDCNTCHSKSGTPIGGVNAPSGRIFHPVQ